MDASLLERARLGDAARTALIEAEGRWRQALGTAAQERLRLRAEIGVLRTRGRDASLAPIAKRQRTGAAPQAVASSNTPDDGGDPALSRTEVYAKYHDAEAALRTERERATEAEGQLELVLDKLQKQLPVYHDKTERLRHALASNESLSGRLATAFGAEQQSKAEAERLQLEVQVLAALAKELTGDLVSKVGGSAEDAVQQVVVIQEELLREQLGFKQREAEAVAAAERPLLAAVEAAKREGAEARQTASQLVEVQAQTDRWRVLYEGSVASLVTGGREVAAPPGAGPTAADKAEVLALLRAGFAGQAKDQLARLQTSGVVPSQVPAAGGEAAMAALKKQLSEAEATAEKMRKAAAHWKAQHGKVKEAADAAAAAAPSAAEAGLAAAAEGETGAAAVQASKERVASLEAELEAQRSQGAASVEQLAAAQADAQAAKEAVRAKEAQVEAAQAAAAASAQEASAASTGDEVVSLRAELVKFKKAASHWKTQHDQLKGGKGSVPAAKGAGLKGGGKSGAS